ncbi:hypothetical protein RSPO_m00597 (plasmid) [Ralstonia solanacearum Po82]|uniref:Uncharacterized protein n=1 Tax=Ralstonia solanacearum (strain Po82) TaxID=1031711 RepID=F6G7V7_RALS8|nr:hypothetical protein RSPO_m00597 [Ralstonia solanacearum Po82]
MRDGARSGRSDACSTACALDAMNRFRFQSNGFAHHCNTASLPPASSPIITSILKFT